MIPPPVSYVDVLVIGAGPAGLMCALALARSGLHVRIIDKNPTKTDAGRADGIQPRTIEVLQSYGLAERLMKEGTQMHMAAFYNPSPKGGIERTARGPDVIAPSARFPFKVTLHQGAIEQIFLDALALMGVRVERPIAPILMELSTDEAQLKDPQSYAVKVALRNDAEPERETEVICAKYVVGCDGAHSWVRSHLGIQMEGEQTDYVWGVVDTAPETNFPDIRNRTLIHSHNGSVMNIPREDGMSRLYLQLADCDVFDERRRVDKSKVNPAKLLEVAKKSFYPYYIEFPNPIDWWAVYIIGQRVASKFSANERIFIAGDACHTHSPKAGQGMNASINDSHNLAWKLVHVLRGWASNKLLKTYELERRRYAQQLIDFDKEWSTLFSDKPRSSSNATGVSHELFFDVFRKYSPFTSGIAIQYTDSAIVHTRNQHVASSLVIGQRMPPSVVIRAADGRPFEVQDLLVSDLRFKVLLFADCTINALARFAEELDNTSSFIKKYGRNTRFDLLVICKAKKEVMDYTEIPALLRSHWSKVFLDDLDTSGKCGGAAYATYGISTAGAAVIVRPDGYIGTIAPLDRPGDIDSYFDSFMTVSARL